MEIKQLRSFIAVVKYGNFTKAARMTYTSQPTISTHIKALEDELGVSLITRDTKNIKVTQKGMELYDCAVNILDLEDRLIARWNDENRNEVHLGVSTIPSTYILPGILEGFTAFNPDVRFDISQGDSSFVEEGLRSGMFDIGLLGNNCGDDVLKCDPFFSDEMVLIAPAKPEFKAMAELAEPPFSKLFEQPFIMREQGSGSRKAAEAIIRGLGFDPDSLNITARINDQESIKNLVAAGLGVSMVSKLAVKEMTASGRLVSFSFPKGTADRLFYIAIGKEKIKSDAVKSFIRYIKKNYARP